MKMEVPVFLALSARLSVLVRPHQHCQNRAQHPPAVERKCRDQVEQDEADIGRQQPEQQGRERGCQISLTLPFALSGIGTPQTPNCAAYLLTSLHFGCRY